MFTREEPQLVINAAAYTDVDGAESDSASVKVNHLGVQHLAEACAAVQAAIDC